MKRSLTLTLMAIVGVAVIAVALVGFRLSQGGMNTSVYAHISDWPVADGTNDVHLEIDMIKDGSSWCNPVDAAMQNTVGSTYQVAVCLTSAITGTAGFQFQLIYNDELNQCVPVAPSGTSLDGNPDANVGVSSFTTPDLGPAANWDCAGAGGLNPPKCDANTATGAGNGVATIACGAAVDPYTLPNGSGVSSPVAVVTFRALGAGLDFLVLTGGKAIDPDLITMIECPSGSEYCIGAYDQKVPPPTVAPTSTPLPPPTSTNTPVPPTATNTPAGVQMVKDANVLVPGIQDTNNLFLMAAGCVNNQEGKGCLVIDVSIIGIADVDNPNDADEVPEGLGAWEHQIRYDHKIVRLTPVVDNTWLISGGRVAGPNACLIQILSENWILEGCVTKDDPNITGQQPGPQGSGLIERIYLAPMLEDLMYRSDFRPTKDNGVVTDIVDDNCEVTDTQAEQIPGTLPGGLTPFCTDVHITVRMLEGDLDLDCDVDVMDDQAVAFRYGSQFGLQLYDKWFDLEPRWSDDDIDIKDLQFVFGRNYSTCQAPIPDDQGIPVAPPQP